MSIAWVTFITGITGVFVVMVLLQLLITLSSKLAVYLDSRKEQEPQS